MHDEKKQRRAVSLTNHALFVAARRALALNIRARRLKARCRSLARPDGYDLEIDERREIRDDARVAAAAEVAVHELRNALLPHLLRDGPARSHPVLASALERALDQADALAAALRGDS